VSRGEIQPSTYAVIFFDAPTSRNAIATASAANPVALVSLVDTRDLAALKRIPGAEVRPFTLSSAGNAARERESLVRRELENVIESGVASRELLSLEPVLERYDGVEIAAAALRLLERERSMRKAQEEAKPRERPPFDRPRERGSFDRPPRERGSFDRPRDLARGKERDFSRGRDSERRDPRKGPPRGREGGRESGRDGGRDGGRHGGRDNRSPRRDRS
jgi:hypothetical protein